MAGHWIYLEAGNVASPAMVSFISVTSHAFVLINKILLALLPEVQIVNS